MRTEGSYLWVDSRRVVTSQKRLQGVAYYPLRRFVSLWLCIG